MILGLMRRDTKPPAAAPRRAFLMIKGGEIPRGRLAMDPPDAALKKSHWTQRMSVP